MGVDPDVISYRLAGRVCVNNRSTVLKVQLSSSTATSDANSYSPVTSVTIVVIFFSVHW